MDWEFQKTILLAPCQAESHPAVHPQLAAVAATMPPRGAQLKLRSPGPGDAAQFAFHQQNAKQISNEYWSVKFELIAFDLRIYSQRIYTMTEAVAAAAAAAQQDSI